MKRNAIKNIITTVLITLTALYLLFIVDTYTLDTISQKIIVFLSFITAGWLFQPLWRNWFGKIASKSIIESVVITIILLSFFQETFLPPLQEQFITLHANRDNSEPIGEVWLVGVELDGIDCETSVLSISNMDGWKHVDEYDDYVYYPSEDNIKNSLSFNVTAEHVKLCFASNSWSGSVNIQQDTNSTLVDLYSEGQDSILFTLENTKTAPSPYYCAVILGAVIFIATMIVVFAEHIAHICRISITSREKKPEKSRLYAEIWFTTFLLTFLYYRDLLFCGILIASLMLNLFFYKLRSSNPSISREGRLHFFIKRLLVFYFSFALIGNKLFLSESRATFSLNKLFYFILFTISITPLFDALKEIINIYIVHMKKGRSYSHNQHPYAIGISCGCVCMVILLVVSIGFFPATVTNDGASHWTQALGFYKLNPAVPILYTLFIRLLTFFFGKSMYVYTVFQLAFFSFVLGEYCVFLSQKGMKTSTLLIASTLIALSPNHSMTLMLLSKNPLFAIINAWSLLLLGQLYISHGECAKKWRWRVQMTISMVGIYFIRPNTFPAYYCIVFIIILIGCLSWKKKALSIRRMAFGIGFVLTLSTVSIITIKGPLYSHYSNETISEIQANSIPITQFMTPFASAEKNDLELPEWATEEMVDILPLEEWGDRYIPYHSDSFSYTQPMPDYTSTSFSEALTMWLKLLLIYPDIVIKDRLDGVESYWNIFQSKGQGAYNERYHLGISDWMPIELLPSNYAEAQLNRQNAYYSPNCMTALVVSIADLLSSNPIIDAFIWRCGIHVVIVLAIFFVEISRKQYGTILLFLPTIVSMFTMFAMVGWQLYQYSYFFPLASVCYFALLPYLEVVSPNMLKLTKTTDSTIDTVASYDSLPS